MAVAIRSWLRDALSMQKICRVIASSHLDFLIMSLLILSGSMLVLGNDNSRAEELEQVLPISPDLCEHMRLHHVLTAPSVVGCERLKLIKFSYVAFDGSLHLDGEMVVMDVAAKNVVNIFGTLREMQFPIAKAKLMDMYDGNDDASMADNNTSTFNSREITGGGAVSLHAYGLAIDINPIQNPYVKHSGVKLTFSPPSGVEYANRLASRPGMAEAVIEVFANNGFSIWGGYWEDPIDYQHFQVGRGLAEQLAKLAPVQAQAAFDNYVERYRTCRQKSARSDCITAGGNGSK